MALVSISAKPTVFTEFQNFIYFRIVISTVSKERVTKVSAYNGEYIRSFGIIVLTITSRKCKEINLYSNHKKIKTTCTKFVAIPFIYISLKNFG